MKQDLKVKNDMKTKYELNNSKPNKASFPTISTIYYQLFQILSDNKLWIIVL